MGSYGVVWGLMRSYGVLIGSCKFLWGFMGSFGVVWDPMGS